MNKGIDARPHPHINLATLTYLFDGALIYRDSLSIIQEIQPGAVKWITAGKGIVGKFIVSASDGKTVRLWQLHNLDALLECGCQWLHAYLTTNPNISKSDRHLCN